MAASCNVFREKFDPYGDPSTVGSRWEKYVRAFKLHLMTTSAKDGGAKFGMFLIAAGIDTQDIWYTLPESKVDPTTLTNPLDVCIQALTGYFVSKTDEPQARSNFRKITPKAEESVAQYVMRLRVAAKDCNFGEEDKAIRDQVLDSVTSKDLKYKFLKKGDGLTLPVMLDIAKKFEQLNLNSAIPSNALPVCRVSTDKERCTRCGRTGHAGTDENCPALKLKCRDCGKKGHFGRCCTSKKVDKRKKRDEKQKQSGHKNGRKTYGRDGISTKRVGSGSDSESDPGNSDLSDFDSEFSFVRRVSMEDESIRFDFSIGGAKLRMLVDSGCKPNIIDLETWKHFKALRPQLLAFERFERTLNPYGDMNKLHIIYKFTARIQIEDRKSEANFYIMKEKGEPLLGRTTATELGILRIGLFPDQAGCVKHVTEPALGKIPNLRVKIPLKENTTPVIQGGGRIALPLRPKLEAKLEELRKLDIIEEVKGPSQWVSRAVVVPKGNDIRLCVDMRMVNLAIPRMKYQLPTMEEMMARLHGATVFSKLDLKMAFHHVELHPDSRELTTFSTHKGLFRYKRLMFGINCAPEIFQQTMDTILADLIKYLIDFIDDILVFGKNQNSHDRALNKTLTRLKENNLELNDKKCIYSVPEVVFVGHLISKDGIRPTQDKVEAVRNFRQPETAEEVRSFLGLVNYVARFAPNVSSIGAPLWDLTKKGVDFEWTKRHGEAFSQLKKLITSSETLGFYHADYPTIVIADASPVGLGAALIQIQNRPRVISYASKSLSQVEQRYSQTEKEALALVWACEKFAIYLYAKEFELHTDHKPLETIFGPRSKPSPRIERWVLRMQSFQYKTIFIQGKSNIADPLSRLLPKTEGETFDEISENIVRRIAIDACEEIVAVTPKEVEEESAKDRECSELRESLRTDRWPEMTKHYEILKTELYSVGKLIMRGNRIFIPSKLRGKVIMVGHEGHMGITSMKNRLRKSVWWKGMDKDIEEFCKSCHGCQLVSRPDAAEPIHRTELPERPWQMLGLDFKGPLPSGHHILVVVDYYSRYYEVSWTKTTTAGQLINLVRPIFARFGYPEAVYNDNGGGFKGDEWKNYLKKHGITALKIPPLHPQANGEVERQNRSLKRRLIIAQAEGKNWQQALDDYLLAYRTTPHSTTGYTPAELMFNYKPKTKVPEIIHFTRNDELRDRDFEKKMAGKVYADKNRKPNPVKAGDRVLVSCPRENGLTPNFYVEPLTVLKRSGNAVTMEDKSGRQLTRDVSKTKKFVEREKQTVEREQHPGNQDTNQVSNPDPDPVTEKSTEPRLSPETPTPTADQATQPKRLPIQTSESGPENGTAETMPGTPAVRRSERIKRSPMYLQDYTK